jgi:putative transposase
MTRQSWIDKVDTVTVVRQCVLAGVSRATVYARQKPRLADGGYLLLSHLIDEDDTASVLRQPQDGDLSQDGWSYR